MHIGPGQNAQRYCSLDSAYFDEDGEADAGEGLTVREPVDGSARFLWKDRPHQKTTVMEALGRLGMEWSEDGPRTSPMRVSSCGRIRAEMVREGVVLSRYLHHSELPQPLVMALRHAEEVIGVSE